MPELSIESNGRIERTAVYLNGEQVRGIKELFLNLDEDGTFDAIMQYEGYDGNIHTKRIFRDQLTALQFSSPAFTEEESKHLNLLQIDSDGDIENTTVGYNGKMLDGLISLFLHIRSATAPERGIADIFKKEKLQPESAVFKSEFVFRNFDDSISREPIF